MCHHHDPLAHSGPLMTANCVPGARVAKTAPPQPAWVRTASGVAGVGSTKAYLPAVNRGAAAPAQSFCSASLLKVMLERTPSTISKRTEIAGDVADDCERAESKAH